MKNALVPPARPIMARLGLICAAGLLAGAVPAPAQAATTASAALTAAGTARPGRVDTLCRRYQHLAVKTAEGSHFVVKNDNYGGQQECFVVRGERPNFTVTRSQLPTWHAKPQAYPFILRGCSWGTCSAPDSDLPKQVSALRRPVATWRTTQVPKGEWDAAFDTWFGTHPMTTGQAAGAEMMIWLNARRIKVPPRTRIVHIDHVRWYLLHWRACHAGTCWNCIQFRRVRPGSSCGRAAPGLAPTGSGPGLDPGPGARRCPAARLASGSCPAASTSSSSTATTRTPWPGSGPPCWTSRSCTRPTTRSSSAPTSTPIPA